MIIAIASIDWGCAVQITAAVAIGSEEGFVATDAQTLCVTEITKTWSHKS